MTASDMLEERRRALDIGASVDDILSGVTSVKSSLTDVQSALLATGHYPDLATTALNQWAAYLAAGPYDDEEDE